MVLGEARLADSSSNLKAAEVLGSSEHDVRARKAADQAIKEERQRAARAAFDVVVAANATQKQRMLPDEQKERPISVKALAMLGDQQLSLDAVKLGGLDELRSRGVGGKVLQMVGSSVMAPVKARDRIGSSTDDGEARCVCFLISFILRRGGGTSENKEQTDHLFTCD